MSVTSTKLSDYFPMIRTKKEILDEISKNINLYNTFYSWDSAQQDEFLNICSGTRGVKILYDTFFKEILNPDATPERLSDFLSTLMDRKVKVKKVLPNDSNRLGDELSLVITDIVVEL